MDSNLRKHKKDSVPSQAFQDEVHRVENGGNAYMKIKEEDISVAVSACSMNQGRKLRTRTDSEMLHQNVKVSPAKKRAPFTRRHVSSRQQRRGKETKMVTRMNSGVSLMKAQWGEPGSSGLEQAAFFPEDTDHGISEDGAMDRNTPERSPRPLYFRDYTEDNNSISQDYIAAHLSDFNIVIKEEVTEEEISTDISTSNWRQRERGGTKMDLEKLASAMQQHPNLFDASHPFHYNKYKRDESWEAICRTLVPNWEPLCKLEKTEKDRELHVKWRSLKDRFRKDLHAVTSAPGGLLSKKIHTHPLFKQLMFLRPSMELRGTSGESANASGSVEDDAMIASEGEAQSLSGLSTDDPPTSTLEAEVPSPHVPPPRRHRRARRGKIGSGLQTRMLLLLLWSILLMD